MITLIKKFLTNHPLFKERKPIPIKRLVLHSVGCPQPNPDVFVKNWNNPSSKYFTQIIIGTTKAYEVLPCMETKGKATYCHHVGKANDHSIGAEMTEPSTIKYTSGARFTDTNPQKTKAHVMATYHNAVEIFAQLCLFHDLDPLEDGVILSHKECHARGIGTNHGDVEHIWNKFGLTMDQFRKDVKSTMDLITKPEKVLHRVQIGAFANYNNAISLKKEAESKGFNTYLVKVGNLYKVQLGAFEVESNASALMKEVESKGFKCFITTEAGTPVTEPPVVIKTIKEGSKVRVKSGSKSYDGKKVSSFVYKKTYTVDELKGDRAVLDLRGLCTAFNVKDLILQ